MTGEDFLRGLQSLQRKAKNAETVAELSEVVERLLNVLVTLQKEEKRR